MALRTSVSSGATPFPHHQRRLSGESLEPERPHGPDLDFAERGHGVRGRHFYCLVEIGTSDDVIAGDPFLVSANGPSETTTSPLAP